MRNDDQQQAGADERNASDERPARLEPQRSPAPTAILILASSDDLVCVDDLCLPGEVLAGSTGATGAESTTDGSTASTRATGSESSASRAEPGIATGAGAGR